MSKPKKLKLPDGVMFTIEGNNFILKLNKGDASIKFFHKIIKYFFKGKECVYEGERCYIVSITDNLNDSDSVNNIVTFELNFPDRERIIMQGMRRVMCQYKDVNLVQKK